MSTYIFSKSGFGLDDFLNDKRLILYNDIPPVWEGFVLFYIMWHSIWAQTHRGLGCTHTFPVCPFSCSWNLIDWGIQTNMILEVVNDSDSIKLHPIKNGKFQGCVTT